MDKEDVVCIHTHTHTETQWNITQLYIKNEILLFAVPWMDLQGIRLSEISQRKTNTV